MHIVRLLTCRYVQVGVVWTLFLWVPGIRKTPILSMVTVVFWLLVPEFANLDTGRAAVEGTLPLCAPSSHHPTSVNCNSSICESEST